MLKRYLFFSILFISLFLSANQAWASNKSYSPTKYYLNETTVAKGFTAVSYNNNFKLGIPGETLSPDHDIKLVIKKVSKKNYNLTGEKLLSVLYKYTFTHADGVQINDGKALWLRLKYNNKYKKKGAKQIKYWDEENQIWQELTSKKVKGRRVVQANIDLSTTVIGVFKKKKVVQEEENNEDYQIGIASWYDWYGAASTKYAKGTIVKVINLDNNKSIEVKIVDYGPFVPGRVIDLPREKFAELADIGAGIINVKVIPIS
ncbi:MAG: septal ring lytic transglycosylase RlpA family protein [Patescibacteria group bacterium]